jgi:putative heme-binding domain-containing protein
VYGTVRDNQLRALEHAGMFTAPLSKPPAEWPRLADPRDTSQDVEARARAYLEVNCSVCHVMAGGGNSQMELTTIVPREKMNLLDARPQHDTFGVANAMLVASGDPDRSVLVQRLSRRGAGQMPPLGTRKIDDEAVALMRQWIHGLKPMRPVVRQWTMEDLEPQLVKLQESRSATAGLAAFRETGCIQCHRFGNEGGSVGPDLSGLAKRSPARQVLESILLPSKVIADEYAAYAIETADGRVLSGRIEREDEHVLVLRPTMAGEQPIEIAKPQIAERHRLDRSNMPTGTVDVLREEEVLDLLAYLLSDPTPMASGAR